MSKAKSKTESKAVVPVEASNKAPVVKATDVDLEAWGVKDHQLTARDVMIPKILAMQAMSKPVVSGEARFGEFRDSLNGVVIGDENRPFEFIPFHMEKVYVVMEEEKGKFRFAAQVPITAELEDHAFEAVSDKGHKQKWYRTLNFYCLLPKEVDGIPYMLSLRSSSAKAGQKIATTMFMKNIQAGKTPASMVLQMSGKKETNDKGTFIVMDVKEIRPSTPEEVGKAFTWVKTVRAGKVKVDHSDIEQEATEGNYSVQEPESTDY